jgi:hypothetical protein
MRGDGDGGAVDEVIKSDSAGETFLGSKTLREEIHDDD